MCPAGLKCRVAKKCRVGGMFRVFHCVVWGKCVGWGKSAGRAKGAQWGNYKEKVKVEGGANVYGLGKIQIFYVGGSKV